VAPILMKSLWLLLILLVALGCDRQVSVQPPSVPVVQEVTIKDGFGKVSRYRFVSPKETNSGSVTVELWEKIEPEDKRYWYTPTMRYELDRTSPPSFNSLMR